MKKALTATLIAGAAAALMGAGTAQADTTDAAFINHLNKEGIDGITYEGYTSADFINFGHVICKKVDEGTSVKATTKHVFSKTDLSQYDSGYLVGASIASYCPWNKPLITG
jgi:hypothetical protein